MKKILIILLINMSANAFVELKSNFFGSMFNFGRNDTIFKTHNTLMFGADLLKLGGYYAYESISYNTVDTTMGAAIRFGEQTFLELQAGYYQRSFKATTSLKGKGIASNIIIGKHFNKLFSLSILLSAKKITSGMDKRLMVDAIPYFGLRVGF